MWDAVWFNPFSNFNQWYTPYGGNEGKIIFRLNVFSTKVKLQSINDVDIPSIDSNKLISHSISLGAVDVFDVTHNNILKTRF